LLTVFSQGRGSEAAPAVPGAGEVESTAHGSYISTQVQSFGHSESAWQLISLGPQNFEVWQSGGTGHSCPAGQGATAQSVSSEHAKPSGQSPSTVHASGTYWQYFAGLGSGSAQPLSPDESAQQGVSLAPATHFMSCGQSVSAWQVIGAFWQKPVSSTMGPASEQSWPGAQPGMLTPFSHSNPEGQSASVLHSTAQAAPAQAMVMPETRKAAAKRVLVGLLMVVSPSVLEAKHIMIRAIRQCAGFVEILPMKRRDQGRWPGTA